MILYAIYLAYFFYRTINVWKSQSKYDFIKTETFRPHFQIPCILFSAFRMFLIFVWLMYKLKATELFDYCMFLYIFFKHLIYWWILLYIAFFVCFPRFICFSFFIYFSLFCFEFCWSHSLIHCCCCCPGLPPNRFVWFYVVALGRTAQSNSFPLSARPRLQLQSPSSSTLLFCAIRFAITQVLNKNQLRNEERKHDVRMMYWCKCG